MHYSNKIQAPDVCQKARKESKKKISDLLNYIISILLTNTLDCFKTLEGQHSPDPPRTTHRKESTTWKFDKISDLFHYNFILTRGGN